MPVPVADLLIKAWTGTGFVTFRGERSTEAVVNWLQRLDRVWDEAEEELPPAVAARATEVARNAVLALPEGAVGVFGVELFVMSDGSIRYNELAPRPHNSGHYTAYVKLSGEPGSANWVNANDSIVHTICYQRR